MFDTANNMRFKQRIYRLKTVRSAAQQKCNMGSEIGASLLGPLVLAEGPLRELLSLQQAEAAHARRDREVLDRHQSNSAKSATLHERIVRPTLFDRLGSI